ncbi:MAG: MFS transporter [Pseudomonadota bacterium]
MTDDVGRPTPPDARELPPLWTGGFIMLLATSFIAYSNIAIFFNFYGHLQNLPIDPAQYGLLIGIYSAVSLAFRPVVSLFFNAGNSRPFIFLGACLVIGALVSYHWAGGFRSMLLVRSFHGLAFVVLGAALMALLVDYIPQERSSEAFGYAGIIVMLPTTIIPPLYPLLSRTFGGFNQILLFFAGVTVLVFPLLLFVRPKKENMAAQSRPSRLGRREIIEDLTDRRVLLTLTSMFMLYCGNALVFFFLAAYAAKLGVSGVGIFFTLSTAAELGVRVAAGSYFDRLNKTRLVGLTMLFLALGYGILALGWARLFFFGLMGTFLGLGWGIALPVFNGLMFDLSSPKFRALNTNLGFQMYQAGFFFGPFVGGYAAARWGFTILFIICGGLSVLGAALILPVKAGQAEKT